MFAKVIVFKQMNYFEGWFLLSAGTTLLLVCCRYLSGSSPELYYSNRLPLLSTPASGTSFFIPTPPPNLSQLLVRQQSHRTRKASPSSLPGRLNRALSLGTIPSLARAGEHMSAEEMRLNANFIFLLFIFISHMKCLNKRTVQKKWLILHLDVRLVRESAGREAPGAVLWKQCRGAWWERYGSLADRLKVLGSLFAPDCAAPNGGILPTESEPKENGEEWLRNSLLNFSYLHANGIFPPLVGFGLQEVSTWCSLLFRWSVSSHAIIRFVSVCFDSCACHFILFMYLNVHESRMQVGERYSLKSMVFISKSTFYHFLFHVNWYLWLWLYLRRAPSAGLLCGSL